MSNDEILDLHQYETQSKLTSENYTLDDFIPHNLIGCGSFGKVFKVKVRKTGEFFAAKISKHEIGKDSSSLLRDLFHEVDIISKLNHPSVLKFIHFSPINFKKKSKPVIITEYASNGSLDVFLEQNRNSPSKVNMNDTRKLIIIYGIASAMSYMHSHRIIHRDLKPGNVLLDDLLFPKIADFGFSKINHSNGSINHLNSTVGTIKGTPIYMSPEIWIKAQYSNASDVYAFAFVVYEIITNKKPFYNWNFFQILASIQQGNRPEFDHPIPSSYKNLIEKCWAQNPSLRPTFDEILDKLKKDKGFITESVNEKDFLDYVNYIDNYKTTFNSNEQIDSLKNKFINLQFNKENNIKIIENVYSSLNYIPFKSIVHMEKSCVDLIAEAGDDQEKLFVIAKSLIEGCKDFQQNTQLGIKYLQKLINDDNIKSIVYYCRILIKGYVIPQNLKKAKKIIQNKLKGNEIEFSLLSGKIFKKEKRYNDAKNCFEKSMKQGDGESTYQYSKMLLMESNTPEKFIQYLTQAIKNGYPKAMYIYGQMLVKGENCQENKEEGLKYIKMAADKGYSKAMYCYSIMLEKEDKEISLKYLKMAINEGNVEAMYKYANELGKNDEYSHRLLKKACDKGHIDSMYSYGMILLKGEGIPSNKEEAAKYLKIAADNGIEDAIAKYGDMLENGDGIPIDIESAIKYYKIGIEKGNSQSMANLGHLLAKSESGYGNKKEAIKYYKMAIEKGNCEAMNNYAYLLDHDTNDDEKEANKEEAAKYYKMAIDQGHAEAMNNYAEMLNKDEYICLNKEEESIKYYKMAIDEGNSDAMNNYAYKFDKGIGVEVNKEEAAKYYKMAIDKGNPIAMCNYAYFLDNGEDADNNKEEVIKYYKMAIDRGNSVAMNNYAFKLDKGIGVDVNKEEAAKYYKLAIENGDSSAMDNYGKMLQRNENDQSNKVKAIKYFKMAIEKGNPEAMNNYGCALFDGIGIDVNKEEAFKYYRMAIEKGNSDAMVNYGYLLSSGNGIEANKEEAIKYYKMAIRKGNSEAMYKLFVAYLKGDGVEQNIDEALKYLKMSADNGNPNAIYTYEYVFK